MATHRQTTTEELDWEHVQSSVAIAQQRLRDIQSRNAGLRAYLVLASRLGEPFGQVEASAGPLDAVDRYPGMVVDGVEKREALELLSRCADKHATSPEDLPALHARLRTVIIRLRFRADTEVQLRFVVLDYALIAALREDPVVDRARTPRHASIRICLGTLGTLLQEVS